MLGILKKIVLEQSETCNLALLNAFSIHVPIVINRRKSRGFVEILLIVKCTVSILEPLLVSLLERRAFN